MFCELINFSYVPVFRQILVRNIRMHRNQWVFGRRFYPFDYTESRFTKMTCILIEEFSMKTKYHSNWASTINQLQTKDWKISGCMRKTRFKSSYCNLFVCQTVRLSRAHDICIYFDGLTSGRWITFFFTIFPSLKIWLKLQLKISHCYCL